MEKKTLSSLAGGAPSLSRSAFYAELAESERERGELYNKQRRPFFLREALLEGERNHPCEFEKREYERKLRGAEKKSRIRIRFIARRLFFHRSLLSLFFFLRPNEQD